ncbi:MAG: hypothetical protein ACYC0V_10965 [Armatimonadota bacterium]
MGLDIVELVVEAEETFGISIPDEDASELVTVGLMHDYIMRKVEMAGKRTCISSKVFYTLRRGLMELTGIERRRITPNSSLYELMPEGKRRRIYFRLGKMTKLRLPKLYSPQWVQIAIPSLTVVAFFALLCIVPFFQGATILSNLVMCILLVLISYVFVILLSPFSIQFSYSYANGDMKTLGDLTKETLSINYKESISTETTLNPDNVWNTLKAIVVDVSCVDPEKVTRDARFVQDLGLG